jgi:murein DD-endopeptidase MepM/ murein hydrolase activator NlpD
MRQPACTLHPIPYTLATGLALVAAATFAAGPPLLPYLNNRLQNLQLQLNTLNQHIAAEQQKQAAALAQNQRLNIGMLSLSRWPTPLLTLTAVGEGHVNTPQLLAHLRSQTAQDLARRQQQLQTLASLRQQAQAQTASIDALRQQAEDGGKHLSADDQAALYAAAASADQLAIGIQNALEPSLTHVASPQTVTEDLTPPPPKPTKAETLAPRTSHLTPALHMPVAAKPRATTTGLLFTPAAGATVSAALSGKVLYAGPFRQFGGLIIIETAPHVQHIFAGLGVLNVHAGQIVQGGQPIGKLPGKSPVHLYWEVRKNGQPLSAGRILAQK